MSARRTEAVRRLGVPSEELDRRALVARVDKVMREGIKALRKSNGLYVRCRTYHPDMLGGKKDRRFDFIAMTVPWPLPPNKDDEEEKTVTFFIRPRYEQNKKDPRYHSVEPVCRKPEDLLGVQVRREPIWLHGRAYHVGGRWAKKEPSFTRLRRSFRVRADGTLNWKRIHEVVAEDAAALAACRDRAEQEQDTTSDTAREVGSLLKAQGVAFKRYRREVGGYGHGPDGMVTFKIGRGDKEVLIEVDGEHIQIVTSPMKLNSPDGAVATVQKLLAVAAPHELGWCSWGKRGY
jgi:hypothetical protein